jgi:hypothetical protein
MSVYVTGEVAIVKDTFKMSGMYKKFDVTLNFRSEFSPFCFLVTDHSYSVLSKILFKERSFATRSENYHVSFEDRVRARVRDRVMNRVRNSSSTITTKSNTTTTTFSVCVRVRVKVMDSNLMLISWCYHTL